MKHSKAVIWTISILVALAALYAGFFVSQQGFFKKTIDENTFHGAYLQQPRALNPFHLMGIDKKPFDNASLQGHWTILFFGFTNCGYLCPTTMTKLNKMYRLLEQKGIKNRPQMVMISIDPQRDTRKKLAQYVTTFNKDFYGARGEEAAIKSMTQELGIAYEKITSKAGETTQNYQMEHSGALIVLNPQGELNAFFTPPLQADLVVKDLILIMS
jgi:protein SCO1/2